MFKERDRAGERESNRSSRRILHETVLHLTSYTHFARIGQTLGFSIFTYINFILSSQSCTAFTLVRSAHFSLPTRPKNDVPTISALEVYTSTTAHNRNLSNPAATRTARSLLGCSVRSARPSAKRHLRVVCGTTTAARDLWNVHSWKPATKTKSWTSWANHRQKRAGPSRRGGADRSRAARLSTDPGERGWRPRKPARF